MVGRVQGGVRSLDLAGVVALLGAAALLGAPGRAHALEFRAIAGDGLGYLALPRQGTVYHLVRVDLARHPIRVADARREGRRAATVDQLGREAGALVAVNGTFFDENYRPLGLVASGGRELNPLRIVSWWAALVVRERGARRAEILTTAQLEALPPEERAGFAAAVQSGPRTVSGGQVLKLKEQSAARTAVCILDPTHLLLIATDGSAVESNELAAFMAAAPGQGGLDCDAGLMFDGGPSTQLWIHAPDLELNLRGGWGVPNALVVLPAAGAEPPPPSE
jgi:uncharacterized protein YigE (DUF2233 family)